MAAAAAAALVAGSAAVTDAVVAPLAPVAIGHTARVRHVALVDAAHQRVGDLQLLSSDPSWVLMNLHVGSYTGRATCELQDVHGHLLMHGSFQLTDGGGEWARSLVVNPRRVAEARVVAPDGITLASATLRIT
jgi:hypothetical protein